MWTRFGFVGLWGYSTKISHKAARAKSKFPHQWAEKSNLEQFRKCVRNIPESVRGQKLQRSKLITKKTWVLKDGWFLYMKLMAEIRRLGNGCVLGKVTNRCALCPHSLYLPESKFCILLLLFVFWICILVKFCIFIFLYSCIFVFLSGAQGVQGFSGSLWIPRQCKYLFPIHLCIQCGCAHHHDDHWSKSFYLKRFCRVWCWRRVNIPFSIPTYAYNGRGLRWNDSL